MTYISKAKKQINKHLALAEKIAMDTVVSEVKKILRKNLNLKAFVMGGGIYFFIDNDNNDVYLYEVVRSYQNINNQACRSLEGKKEFARLFNFLNDFERDLRLSGIHLKVTRDEILAEEKGLK